MATKLKSAGPLRLLERDAELAILAAEVERVAGGAGSIVVIQGGAGLGKTALAEAALESARSRGFVVLRGVGAEIESDLPFGVARQLFTSEIGSETASPGSTAAEGPAREFLASLTLERESDRATLVNSLFWLTTNLAEQRPLTVLLDDAQWVDQGTMSYVGYLARRIEDLPVLLIVVARTTVEPTEGDLLTRISTGSDVVRIEPGHLSLAAANTLIEERFGRVRPELAEACHATTHGNPFLLRSLLATLPDGVSDTGSALEAVIGSGEILDMALRPFTALGRSALALATAIAILDGDADPGVAAAVSGLGEEESTRAMDGLLAGGLLTRSPTGVRIAHPLQRVALERAAGLAEVARLHASAARALQLAGDLPERIAVHLARAAPILEGWAVASLRAAARAAAGRGDPEIAAGFLRLALATAPPDEKAAIRLELGKAGFLAGQPDAVDHLRAVFAGSSDLGLRLEAAGALSQALFVHGQPADGIRVLREAGAVLPAGSEPQLMLRASTAVAAVASGFFPVAFETIAEIHAAAGGEAPRGDTPAGRAALVAEGVVRLFHNEHRDACLPLIRRGLGAGLLIDEQGPQSLFVTTGLYGLMCAGAWEEASSAFDRAGAVARASGSPGALEAVLGPRSYLSFLLGELGEAEVDARQAIALHDDFGWEMGAAATRAFLARVMIERGDLDQAESLLPTGEIADAALHDFQLTGVLFVRGELRLAQRRGEEALADFLACGAAMDAFGFFTPAINAWHGGTARAHLALGSREQAVEASAKEVALAREFGVGWVLASALRIHGTTLDGAPSLAALEEAVELAGGAGARLEQARALLDHGVALRRSGANGLARERLALALDLAGRVGAVALASTALVELRVAGARPRRSKVTGVGSLTASERRVADCAASGMTNAEIAQTLFVTPKTVEKHLGNAYAKLAIRGRAELGARLSAAE